MDKKQVSKAQKEALIRYRRKTYDVIQVKSRKEIGLNDRIDLAADKAGLSKNAYIIAAVEKQLENDGFDRESMALKDMSN